MQMAPEGHTNPGPPSYTIRRSAVLVLIHASDESLSIPFTLRPTNLGHHGGEVSLPGGGFESIDDTLKDTALRETEEELGIPTVDVRILGDLTPLYIAPSQNLVHPYIGWLPQLPTLDPDPREVEAVLDVPLAHLLNHESLDRHHWIYRGEERTAPCYRVGQICIWGATAMMLNELLAVIRERSTLQSRPPFPVQP